MHRLVLALAAVFALMTPGVATADESRSIDSLRAEDLRGCFAVSAKGRMACVRTLRGRAQLELRGIENWRLYKVELIGSKEAPHDAAATPKRKMKAVRALLRKRGYVPIVPSPSTEGDFEVPGSPCALRVSADSAFVMSVRGDKVRPWLETGGPGGEVRLADIHVQPDADRLFITLDHTTDGDIVTRQTKVMKLSDLTSREECAP